MSGSRKAICGMIAALLATTAVPGFAEPADDVREELEQMKRKIERLEKEVQETEHKAEAAARSSQAEDQAMSKWHLSGYASATATETDESGTEDFFALSAFNPVFHYLWGDLVFFEGELEFEVEDDGGTETALEYATISLLAHDYLTLVAGKFISPIGQFQERLHPDWINKLPEAPAGFGHGGIQPLSDVGIQARGGVPVGPALATYAVFAGNGPRVGGHGPELEGFGNDDNGDKSVGGRIGLLPVPWLEVGGSILRADAGVEEGSGNPEFLLFGADMAITRGNFDFRFEYLNGNLDAFRAEPHGHGEEEEVPAEDDHAEEGAVEAGEEAGHEEEEEGQLVRRQVETDVAPETDFEAWYVQGAYRLSGLTNVPVVRNLEPVVRYGQFSVDGFEGFRGDAEDRISFGVNYLFTSSLIGKLAVDFRDFDAVDRDDHRRFQAQIAYGF